MADETKQQEVLKPKRQKRERAAIIPLPPPAELRLGMLAIHDPKEMIHRASELATALAEIIHAQELYVVIKNKKYVKAEGWTTLGNMLGVVPIEESCEPLTDGKGFKARVKLIRLNDGMQVGGASAICYLKETGWNNPDDFSTYSKAITRATGKAFRLSFAWVMKLAGFQVTPADELFEVEGSEEESEKVLKAKLAELEEKKANQAAKREENKLAKVSAFITWPESHNGHKFFLSGKTALMEHHLWKFLNETCGGNWNERDGGFYFASELAPGIRQEIRAKGCPLIERDYTGLLQESIAQANAKKSSGGANGKSTDQVPRKAQSAGAPSEREPGDEIEPQVPL